MEWNALAGTLINKLASVLPEDALKTKICTTADRKKRLVNVSTLKDDLLAVLGHEQAMPLAVVGGVSPFATSYSMPRLESSVASTEM